jgi:hypothetical protein
MYPVPSRVSRSSGAIWARVVGSLGQYSGGFTEQPEAIPRLKISSIQGANGFDTGTSPKTPTGGGGS